MTIRFSFIVPVYNRAGMIARSIDSVLAQRGELGEKIEVIVVDDASTDDTVARVRAYTDPRVKVVELSRNRGVCAARNAAIDIARGEWCVMLDSDFTMLPGGIETLDKLCFVASPEVVNVATICEWDDGAVTPIPQPSHDLDLDHDAWVRWTSTLVVSEFFNCIRRSALDRVRYPEYRAYEGCFHIALCRLGRFTLTRVAVSKVHTDADNRITAAPPAALARRLLREAVDGACDADNQLRTYGETFRTAAPRTYAELTARTLELHLLAGDRIGALDALLRRPAGFTVARELGIVPLGMLSPRILAAARGLWRHRTSLTPSSVLDALTVLASPTQPRQR